MDSNVWIPWEGWSLVRKIGQGSFGTVYEIERQMGSIIEKSALKVISIPKNEDQIRELYADGYDYESIAARFQSQYDNILQEYYLMTKVKGNGNIVYCDDFYSTPHNDGVGWDIYIRMELLTPLTDYLGKSFQVSDELVIKLGSDICNALRVCEDNGILHRDIKPQNIFVSKDGSFKLGDFGVAKLSDHTTNATMTGTYRYMAPEVAREAPYNSGADRYSLGIVMYWLLNERRTPFLPLPPNVITEENEMSARAKRLRGDRIPAPKHGSDYLKRIVLKAVAFEPEARFSSADAMRKTLDALRTDNDVTLNHILSESGFQQQEGKTNEPIIDTPILPIADSAVAENEGETIGKSMPIQPNSEDILVVGLEDNTIGAWSNPTATKKLKGNTKPKERKSKDRASKHPQAKTNTIVESRGKKDTLKMWAIILGCLVVLAGIIVAAIFLFPTNQPTLDPNILDGTYISQGLVSQKITFSQNGEVIMSAFGLNVRGWYQIDGNTIVIIYYILGSEYEWESSFYRGDYSVFIDGEEFIKQ